MGGWKDKKCFREREEYVSTFTLGKATTWANLCKANRKIHRRLCTQKQMESSLNYYFYGINMTRELKAYIWHSSKLKLELKLDKLLSVDIDFL